MEFRAFFEKDKLRTLDSKILLEFLTRYKKATPMSSPNYSTITQIMEEIREDMEMSQLALVNLLKPLMTGETQAQVARLIQNML